MSEIELSAADRAKIRVECLKAAVGTVAGDDPISARELIRVAGQLENYVMTGDIPTDAPATVRAVK